MGTVSLKPFFFNENLKERKKRLRFSTFVTKKVMKTVVFTVLLELESNVPVMNRG